MVASAQLRGQPETASFTLCGVHEPHCNLLELDARGRWNPGCRSGTIRSRRRSSPCAAPCRRRGPTPCRPRSGRPRPRAAAPSCTPSRSMRWPPVTLTVGMPNFSATSAIARNSPRGGHAAPHARHDRIGAVLLDVGVHPLVDEARLLVVAVFAGPGAQQVIVQRGPAACAAVRRLPVERRITSGMVFSCCSQDGARAPRRARASVHLHIGLTFGAAPIVAAEGEARAAPRPWQVHEPQDAEALVCARTVVQRGQPLARRSRRGCVPLQTPLQPQISAVSAIAATPNRPLRPPSPDGGPKTSRRAARRHRRRRASGWKYQAPSAASPYSTAPTSLSSRSTSRL